MKALTFSVLSLTLLFSFGCGAGSPDPANTADSIYYGDIITVNDAQPYVEAIAVKDGKILMVGNRAEIEQNHKGASTRMVDLAGKTLLPGFLDPHSHYFSSLTVAIRSTSLPRPPGRARTSPASSPP